jgi:hypothetical protein
MLLPFGPFLDPSVDALDLIGHQSIVNFRRRHAFRVIVSSDPTQQLAGLRFSCDDDPWRLFVAEYSITQVEPQIAFSLFRVWPVALETLFRKDRADIAGEFDGRKIGFCRRHPCGRRQQAGGNCQEHNERLRKHSHAGHFSSLLPSHLLLNKLH